MSKKQKYETDWWVEAQSRNASNFCLQLMVVVYLVIIPVVLILSVMFQMWLENLISSGG